MRSHGRHPLRVLYKDPYLHGATPAAAYMTKVTGHLHKIRMTRMDIDYA